MPQEPLVKPQTKTGNGLSNSLFDPVAVADPTPAILIVTLVKSMHGRLGNVVVTFAVSAVPVTVICAPVNGVVPKVPEAGPLNT